MIGALLLKHGVDTQMSANIQSHCAARLPAGLSEDVVFTFPGMEPVAGCAVGRRSVVRRAWLL